MSTFRKAHSVLHEAAGTYTNGVWSGGTRSVSSVQMSAQPLNSGQVHGRIDRSENMVQINGALNYVHGRIDRSENQSKSVRRASQVHGRIDRSENSQNLD